MKILVLGHTGMLGHMVYKYFSSKKCELIITSKRWPSREFKDEIINFWHNFSGDYIINCIAAIPQRKKNNFDINVDLLVWLDNEIDSVSDKVKVIYPGSDIDEETSGYSISKKNAHKFVIDKSRNTKMIRTSIIGPELKLKDCTFEWFMNSKNKVYGWDKNYWNGITTLEWSKICYNIILDWNSYGILNTPSTDCISKYNLLYIIKEVFNKDITIYKNSNVEINRCLERNIEVKDIRQQLVELKEFYYDS